MFPIKKQIPPNGTPSLNGNGHSVDVGYLTDPPAPVNRLAKIPDTAFEKVRK